MSRASVSKQLDLWGHKHLVMDEYKAVKLPKRPWLRISEVAAYLDVSERTVSNWIDEKKLTAFKKGQTVRIPKNGLRRFIAHHHTDRPTPEEFNGRRAAIAKVKATIKQNLPAELEKESKKRIASAIYNGIKDEIKEIADAL